ncbi:MAG: cytochrome P450 [Acidobacteriota bacterium]
MTTQADAPNPDTPQSPITAVTHRDPYPYYAELVAQTPLYYSDALQLWIACGADAVNAVLTSDLCHVRPPAEPVPKALLGSAAGDIFRHLVRMNDGETHRPMKQAVSSTFATLDMAFVTEESARWACTLSREVAGESDFSELTEFSFTFPVFVVASLIGVPPTDLPEVAMWLRNFVGCLAPSGSPEQIELGKIAAGHLLDLFRGLLADNPTRSGDGVLSRFAGGATQSGIKDREAIIANAIGFLSQAFEATAGLIGNSLVTLASHDEVRQQVRRDPDILLKVVREVVRFDAPIQNTRRFVATSGIVAGEEMREGDAVLVVLAAANRDPAANALPAKFDLNRKERQVFTFGVGRHACPGEMLATTIAKAGVSQLIERGIRLEELVDSFTYRASANARIPIWAQTGHFGG